MEVLGGLLLALFCLVVLGLPLLRASRGRRSPTLQEALEQAVAQRESVYLEMQSLAQGRRQNAVSEEEFQAQWNGLRVQAAQALREQRRLGEMLRALDKSLEEEIASRRRAVSGKGGSL
jgi:hypothetical protein